MNRYTVNRGKQLKMCRVYRGFSQAELSKKVNGLSQSNLSKFEHGFDTIAEDKLKEIMKVLDWNFDWLEVKHPKPDFGY